MASGAPISIIRGIARMGDGQFQRWAAKIGFTPKPDPDGETMGAFRRRVIDSLDQLTEEIERLENGG